jgi:hypothetical protein
LSEALFSEASLQKQRNTEAVEVAPNTSVSARVETPACSHIAFG